MKAKGRTSLRSYSNLDDSSGRDLLRREELYVFGKVEMSKMDRLSLIWVRAAMLSEMY